MESCLLRTQRRRQRAVKRRLRYAGRARVFIADAMERVEHDAKRAIAAVNEGDMLTTQMAVLKRFGKRATLDTIALRRECSGPRCRRKTGIRSSPNKSNRLQIGLGPRLLRV